MAKRIRNNRPDRSHLHVVPPIEAEPEVEDTTEDEEDLSTPRRMTLLDATEALGMQIRGICQRTKLSEQTVLSLFSFQYQQVERERMNLGQGQAAIDAIAAEQAAKQAAAEEAEAETPREPDEVITADE